MSINYGMNIKRGLAAGGFGVRDSDGNVTDLVDDSGIFESLNAEEIQAISVIVQGGITLKEGTIHLPELEEALSEGPESGVILFFHDGSLKYIDEDDNVEVLSEDA